MLTKKNIMKKYTITDQRKIKELAKKTKKVTIISTVIILTLIIGFTVFLFSEDGAKIPVIPLILVVLLFAVLFSLLVKQINDMLFKLSKHRFVTIGDDAITIGTSTAFMEELNYVQKYFYNRVNRFGTHDDKTFYASKIKSINQTRKGLQFKVSGLIGDVVTIPNEIDKLHEIKQEINKMMYASNNVLKIK